MFEGSLIGVLLVIMIFLGIMIWQKDASDHKT